MKKLDVCAVAVLVVLALLLGYIAGSVATKQRLIQTAPWNANTGVRAGHFEATPRPPSVHCQPLQQRDFRLREAATDDRHHTRERRRAMAPAQPGRPCFTPV